MPKLRNVSLDVIRSLAAMEVMFCHLRNFIFENYSTISESNSNLGIKCFYYLSSFGHQSVIIFFVLSGYLVGGAVISAKKENFWGYYAIQRLTRLWIVLIPCLLATLLWNGLGFYTGGADYMKGFMNPPIFSAPSSGTHHLDAITFLGNCFFLQTIVVPTYGDNGPLWSLTNEFWYYVLFPLIYWGCLKKYFKRNTRICYILLAATLFYLLPNTIRLGFIVWMLGVLVKVFENKDMLRFTRSNLFGNLAIVVFFITLGLSKNHDISDLTLGLTFTLALPWLLGISYSFTIVEKIFQRTSDFSYTLYLSHFSFCSFLWYTFLDSERLTPSPLAFVRFSIISVAVLIYSYLFSLVSEHHTIRFRNWVTQLFYQN